VSEEDIDPNVLRAQTINELDEVVTEFLNMGPNGEALDTINETCAKVIENCQANFEKTGNPTFLGMSYVIAMGINNAILAWLDREELDACDEE
jgi:hypothetical protein